MTMDPPELQTSAATAASAVGEAILADDKILTLKRSKKRTQGKKSKKAKKTPSAENEGQLYGILDEPNIDYVQFGVSQRFHTWYGTNVYFENGTRKLGITVEGKKNRIKDVEETDSEPSKVWLDTLFVCEYCFKYTDDEQKLVDHDRVCSYKSRCAPGRIQYKSPEYTIRKVKGSKHVLFCQCLCLFTKLFLDNKSMYFKVENYEFFILYKTGSNKPMGFFSKDLVSFQQNNLACILIFPPYQRRQLGTLLMEFSYKLSRAEGVITGPELPLSPFGLIGYLHLWANVIAYQLEAGELSERAEVTLDEISHCTGFRINDIIMALKYMQCIDSDYKIYLAHIRAWKKKQADKGKLGTNTRGNMMIDDEYLLIDV